MTFDYYSTDKYFQFCKAIGFIEANDVFLLGAFKHEQLLNNPLLLKIFIKLFPELRFCNSNQDIEQSEINSIINKIKPFRCLKNSIDNQKNSLFVKKENHTIILDLEKDQKILWEKMDYSLQKQIKKAQTMGLSVVKIDSLKEFDQYIKSLKLFRDNLGFKTVPLKISTMQWNLMHSTNKEESCYEIFLCKDKNGQLLSGLGIIINPQSKNFIEVSSFRTPLCIKNSLPANDFLKWEIIKWGQSSKFKYYDLAGVNPNANQNSKEYNIYRFKNKWGGYLTQYYTYEKYFPENGWYYPTMLWILKKIKKI